jgi:hypothetical protein
VTLQAFSKPSASLQQAFSKPAPYSRNGLSIRQSRFYRWSGRAGPAQKKGDQEAAV